MLSVTYKHFMLSVIMTNAVILSVIIPSVVTPFFANYSSLIMVREKMLSKNFLIKKNNICNGKARSDEAQD
jgi:hypothetical protein